MVGGEVGRGGGDLWCCTPIREDAALRELAGGMLDSDLDPLVKKELGVPVGRRGVAVFELASGWKERDEKTRSALVELQPRRRPRPPTLKDHSNSSSLLPKPSWAPTASPSAPAPSPSEHPDLAGQRSRAVRLLEQTQLPTRQYHPVPLLEHFPRQTHAAKHIH